MSFVISISRYLLPLLTVMILTKCVLALLLGHPKDKIYGYIIDMVDGERYPLNMWETSIGRSSSCDIVVGYDTISRFHAVISRRIDGWYIYDLLSKSGIAINDEKATKKTTIRNGDILTIGQMKYKFEVVNDPVQRVGKKKGKRNSQPVNTQPQPTAHEYPYPQQGAAFDSSYNRPQNPYGANYDSSFGGDFYDNDNRPNLNFQKSPSSFSAEDYSSYSGSIFTEHPSYTVETPNRTNDSGAFQSYVQQPAIINRDTGEVFALCGNLVTIGRNRNCDIKLTAPNASRRHANLVLYDDGWAIEDAGSSVGTLLNGNRITEPQLLFDGDIIALGDERLYYTVRSGNTA
ncbi:MAG: FHA domain-containing protein [Faecalibacterium sp.]|nr:FHA domain-containing protein [Ruminococcus sp.]MCM1392014.1 FHA domain-containing protein [Ruminococcus sp.]MCM1485726.1 FHA domain-containing protein [Faecalibacterium sp.]